jgi:hypothetical protein
MVSEKKPSIYSDRGTIGSIDELDEYGVWVKKEPQDLSPANTGEEFDDLSLPDFDTDMEVAEDPAELGEIDDPYIPEIDLSEAETAFGKPDTVESGGEVPEAGDDFEGFTIPENDSASGEDFFLTEETAEADEGRDRSDLSTQLLMKIAEELSSIRTELTSLKKEFAGIRVEAPAGDKEDMSGAAQHGGFFSEEDDEKIALTGDEMNNILNTADFTEEAGKADEPEVAFDIGETAEDIVLADAGEPDAGFDLSETAEDIVLADAGEPDAAFDIGETAEDIVLADAGELEAGFDLSEAAEPAASDAEEAEEEEIEIDFEDLGIDLNIDPSDFDKAREADADGEQSLSVEEDAIDPSLADMAIDLVTTGEFAGDVLGAIAEEELLMEEPLPDEKTAEENLFTEETIPPETAEAEMDEISLVDEFVDTDVLQQLRSQGAEPMTPAPEDSSYLEDDPFAGAIDDSHELDLASLDLSDAVIDEPDLSGEITENPVEEPLLDEISLDGLDDISIDLEDMEDVESEPLSGAILVDESPLAEDSASPDESLELSLATEDDSFAQVIPEGFEAEVAESPIPFDDDLEGAFDLTEDIATPLEISESSPDTAEAPLSDEFSLDTADTGIAAIETDSAGMEAPAAAETFDIPAGLKSELKTVLSYMDHLLESLPEDKIEEFAKSEYFDSYKKLFKELGLV